MHQLALRLYRPTMPTQHGPVVLIPQLRYSVLITNVAGARTGAGAAAALRAAKPHAAKPHAVIAVIAVIAVPVIKTIYVYLLQINYDEL